MHFAKAIYSDETGATGIEYGLIVALVALAAMAGFDDVGNVVDNSFGNTADRYDAVNVPG